VRTTFGVAAPPEAWSRLSDPVRLAAALPGARRVSVDDDGTLSVTADVAVASVTGLWSGTVTPVDADAIRIAGAGTPGRLDLEVRAAPDRSRLTVEGEVDGPLAAVGGTVLSAAARRLAEDLLANLSGPGPSPLASDTATVADVTASPMQPAGAGGLAWRAGAARGLAAVTGVAVVVVAVVRWRRGRDLAASTPEYRSMRRQIVRGGLR
jgi:carbon monoxide dehydrogenase subunit G